MQAQDGYANVVLFQHFDQACYLLFEMTFTICSPGGPGINDMLKYTNFVETSDRNMEER